MVTSLDTHGPTCQVQIHSRCISHPSPISTKLTKMAKHRPFRASHNKILSRLVTGTMSAAASRSCPLLFSGVGLRELVFAECLTRPKLGLSKEISLFSLATRTQYSQTFYTLAFLLLVLGRSAPSD